MKKKKLLIRGLAVLLTSVIVTGLIFCVTNVRTNVHTVYGSTSGKTIAGLGTNIIADPIVPTSENAAWKGSYVYYGTYDGNPVKYRVLDKDSTDFGGTTMLLDCDTVLWAGSDPSSAFDADSNVWADSDIKSYLNSTFLTTSFSTPEQNAIASSNKASAITGKDGNGRSNIAWTSLNGEKIFFLDAKEATNTSYGYYDTKYDATGRIKTGCKTGDITSWWLRSPATANDRDGAAFVDKDAYLNSSYVLYDYVGVSPALNINLSSVLFSSVISGAAGETGTEYKLTLLDDNMTIAVDGTVTRKGDVITVPYIISGTNSANASQVSLLILDKEYTVGNTNNAQVLAYGALDADTGKFTLPSDLSDKVCGSDYYAYIVAEDVNGEKETDYASTPVKITFKEEIIETTETEETTTSIEETTPYTETEETTTSIEETTENLEIEEVTIVTEEATTEKNTDEPSTEELTTEEPTVGHEEETTTYISEDNSTENETTSTIADNTDNTGDSGKNGNGWIIWLILIIIIIFVLMFFLLFIIKKKKADEEQEVTEENKDI